MRHVLLIVNQFVRGDNGQDLLEYGMIAALIAVASVIAVQSVGNQVSAVLWRFIADTPI